MVRGTNLAIDSLILDPKSGVLLEVLRSGLGTCKNGVVHSLMRCFVHLPGAPSSICACFLKCSPYFT